MRLALVCAAALAACAWGGREDSHGVLGTDARVRMDGGGGGGGDSGGDTPPSTAHLVLSEILLNSVGGEFVEIMNPTGQTVDLTGYYLADIAQYWQLPAAVPAVASSDFIVRFPASSSLAPGGVATISTSSAATFMAVHGIAPTYSITAGTMIAISVGTAPTLTDAGEVVVLFSWNGTDDLVKDVDIMSPGIPTTANRLSAAVKSGVLQGASTYAIDANTIPMTQPSSPAANLSTKRIAPETGHETQAGTGNGITGHDETSEDTAVTWDTTFTAPTPGQVPAGL